MTAQMVICKTIWQTEHIYDNRYKASGFQRALGIQTSYYRIIYHAQGKIFFKCNFLTDFKFGHQPNMTGWLCDAFDRNLSKTGRRLNFFPGQQLPLGLIVSGPQGRGFGQQAVDQRSAVLGVTQYLDQGARSV